MLLPLVRVTVSHRTLQLPHSNSRRSVHRSQRASISLPSRRTDALCRFSHRGVCITWSTPPFREISRSSRSPPSLWNAYGARGPARRVPHPLLHLHAPVGFVTQRRRVRIDSFPLHDLYLRNRRRIRSPIHLDEQVASAGDGHPREAVPGRQARREVRCDHSTAYPFSPQAPVPPLSTTPL